MAIVEIKFRPWTGKASLEVQVGDNVEPKFRFRAALELVAKEALEGKRSGAVLTGAVLTGAVLTGAVLTRAVLTDADLTGAVLTRAVLTDAVLTRADLTGAVLTGAVLTRAVLTGAVLTRAVLTDADLRSFKTDFWSILLQNQNEVPGLIDALREGRVDGSTYTGTCACLVGTIANVRGVSVSDLETDSSRPAERWFLIIRKGDKPGDGSGGGFAAGKALEWAEEFCELIGLPAPAAAQVSA